MQSTPTKALVLALIEKHIEIYGSLDKYRGVVSLHSLARLAVVEREKPNELEKLRSYFMPYIPGEARFDCNFPNYYCGGLGTSYMLWQGLLPEAESIVRKYAEEIRIDAPRDPEGILCHPKFPEKHQIWIDAAFAATPFQLFAGLAFENEEYIEDAFQHTAKMVRILRDPDNGLLHQGRNFNANRPGSISEDHWSRGNGWGIYALNELACYLPDDHPRKDEAVQLYLDLLKACLAVRSPEGLWYQEMTEPLSYIETSGSALILYAIGCGLECCLLNDGWREIFDQGMSALLVYISEQYDVFHTCDSCLCPGDGTILEYMARPAVVNDSHAFGPMALAFGQAYKLGIETISRP